MNGPLRILHLEDNPNDAELVREALARYGIEAEWQHAQSGEQFVAALERGGFSLILADYQLPGFDGLAALAMAREKCPDVPFVFVSGTLQEDVAIESLKAGASDYVFKIKLSRLGPVVDRALEEARMRRDRIEYERMLQAFVSATANITGHEFLRALARGLADALRARYAFIGLIADRDATKVRTVAFWAGAGQGENFEYELAGTPCANVVGKAEYFCPRDVQRLFPRDTRLADMGVESYLGVPFARGEGAPFGLLAVLDVRPMETWTHLRPLLRIFAGRAAAERERLEAEDALRDYTEQLRRLSRRLFEVEETERRRLARELHDRIGQNVTALTLSLNMVRSELPAESLQKVTQQLNDCETLLYSTATLVRDVMADLRPPGLDELGLLAALTEHARQVAGRSGFSVTVRGTELTPRLPPAPEIMLFRIAQEALINVAKHARATEGILSLESRPDVVVLTIADNGLGFDPAARASQARPNLGMVNMRERAEAIGGVFRVESAPGQGTRVIVEAPRAAPSGND